MRTKHQKKSQERAIEAGKVRLVEQLKSKPPETRKSERKGKRGREERGRILEECVKETGRRVERDGRRRRQGQGRGGGGERGQNGREGMV